MSTKKNTISAKSINAVSKSIRLRRESVSAICREFQAVWSKVYPEEFKPYQQAAIKAAQELKTDEAKQARYELELVASMRKSLQLTDEETALIKELHEAGLNYSKINLEAIEAGLAGLNYINADGELCERRKNKETQGWDYVPVKKWTVNKFGRFLRLANIEVK